MYKISEIIGIKLIDTDTLQELGSITDIIWDKPSGKCALVTDSGAFTADKIVSTDGDTMNVIAATATELGETIVNKVVYENTGKFLGRASDVEFGNTLKLFKIYLEDETEYRRSKIAAVKDALIIRVPAPPRPKKPKTVEQADTTTVREQTDVIVNVKQATSARWRQNRKYGDFSFLIGKVTDKTITNFQGEVMVKLGERVTPDILRQAKISGKLIELCLHTK
ncbi:MAG: hypothetical protein J1F65_04460 [Clostridiales bacterium]|nr:hypothetical protein [Clostridiales bacterium]